MRPRSRSPESSRAERSERGAVLVQTVIAFIGLTAFGAFVTDYGILWSARRQAQNAADAGAMAAAVSLGFVDPDRPGAGAHGRPRSRPPQQPGLGCRRRTSPQPMSPSRPCPVGSPGSGTNTCVRVDVFRNQRASGNPLPTIFGTLVGVIDQGVKATATAEVSLRQHHELREAVRDSRQVDRERKRGPLVTRPTASTSCRRKHAGADS